MSVISSQENSIVKMLKKLQNKKERLREKLFIVEGIRNVEEAFINNAEVKYLVLSESQIDKMAGLNGFLNNSVKKIVLSDKIFKHISHMTTPQGIAVVVKIKEYKMQNLIEKCGDLLVIIDSIQDPGNVGTIIRTSSAAGAAAVIIGKGSADPYSAKVANSSMGAVFQIPIICAENLLETVNNLKEEYDYKTIASDIRADNLYYDLDLTGKTAFVIGNENKGVKKHILKAVDLVVKIPIQDKADSLNASAAASVLIYEKVRQQHLTE